LCKFWDERFNALSIKIHTVNDPLFNYFTPLPRALSTVNAFKNMPSPLTLQQSVDFLTPRLYWLHFNYITMPAIYAAFRDRDDFYTNRPLTPTCKQAYHAVWGQWYSLFRLRVRALGAAFGAEDHGGVAAHRLLQSADYRVDRLHESLLTLLRLVDTAGVVFV
jgi:hypothetical protein